jgi:uncharacterized membrane protein
MTRHPAAQEDHMLLLHIVSASLALVIGGALLALDKRLRIHPRLGSIYHWTMFVVAVSALGISAMRGRAVVFTYLAPPSYALALLGYASAKRRWRGWLRWHITGQTGSYVALLTGLAVQMVLTNVPRAFLTTHSRIIILTALLGPTLVALPFIKRTQARWNGKRRPDLRAAA